MSVATIDRNKRFLADLFGGQEFRGHAVSIDPCVPPAPSTEDYTCATQSLDVWASWIVQKYEIGLQWVEALQDDSVPCADMLTGTQIFAAAFGCAVHTSEYGKPAAMPLVTTAQEADRLRVPGIDSPPLDRIWRMAEIVRRRLGPDVPLSVPDIQSPFDIAALIWRKQDMYLALYDSPDAVKQLVAKCQQLLERFLVEYQRRFAPVNMIHWPRTWAPAGLGCSLSEDEAGAMSRQMFEEFCLPPLVSLSNTFGGMFMHSCADADHLYGSFNKIPRLRGLQRVFQSSGPRPAIEVFSGHTVLLMSGFEEKAAAEIVQMALPQTRLYFSMAAKSLDDARGIHERTRLLCPRTGIA
jgi:hypothetical protein